MFNLHEIKKARIIILVWFSFLIFLTFIHLVVISLIYSFMQNDKSYFVDKYSDIVGTKIFEFITASKPFSIIPNLITSILVIIVSVIVISKIYKFATIDIKDEVSIDWNIKTGLIGSKRRKAKELKELNYVISVPLVNERLFVSISLLSIVAAIVSDGIFIFSIYSAMKLTMVTILINLILSWIISTFLNWFMNRVRKLPDNDKLRKSFNKEKISQLSSHNIRHYVKNMNLKTIQYYVSPKWMFKNDEVEKMRTTYLSLVVYLESELLLFSNLINIEDLNQERIISLKAKVLELNKNKLDINSKANKIRKILEEAKFDKINYKKFSDEKILELFYIFKIFLFKKFIYTDLYKNYLTSLFKLSNYQSDMLANDVEWVYNEKQ
ncbi:hypothetical protein SHELI_v1c06480 [Spiroplasma helicoides]|uniref:Uncharacterized protein n=1 Tax=Spiroplasma helicoides TaxID=216938 RepID=A0A1B3SKZ0_9MOLU|nr:hypothetical protein [Spiroplasma helicoides]AOG60599.1 hypothetical protein SHELI_v1c06480 [Spiroplasma helicoides]